MFLDTTLKALFVKSGYIAFHQTEKLLLLKRIKRKAIDRAYFETI